MHFYSVLVQNEGLICECCLRRKPMGQRRSRSGVDRQRLVLINNEKTHNSTRLKNQR